MTTDKILNRAFWLDNKTKREIANAIKDYPLTAKERIKMSVLLSAIIFAETSIAKEGKILTRMIKFSICKFKPFDRFLKTVGKWNLHLCHAEKFNLTEKVFRQKLLSEEGIFLVIQYLLLHIGLEKPLPHIFAEYVIGEEATFIAAVQKGINHFLKRKNLPPIAEDGLLGSETKKGWDHFNNGFSTLHIERREDKKKILEKLKKMHFPTTPFIPATISKRNFGYLFRIIRQKKWNKILNIFRNHINVPFYVQEGMRCAKILFKENVA